MQGMKLSIKKYGKEDTNDWDRFINDESINGTFLQSRKFLSYHPKDRFEDCSLMIYEADYIVAVIPACVLYEDETKIFYSHKGSTFGGVIINKKHYKIKYVARIFELLEDFFKEQGFTEIYLKQTGELFCHKDTSMLDYFLFYYNYQSFRELSIYIDLNEAEIEDIYQKFDDRKKRNFKIASRHNLDFRILHDSEIPSFHRMLEDNLRKYDAKPIHTIEELKLLKNILAEKISFYGVLFEGELIAACMYFSFDGTVLHTQNPCMDYEHKDKRAMEFLIFNMVRIAFEKKYSFFSFGISTEDLGRKLNISLAEFKEGFAGGYKNNTIYWKEISN